MKEWEVYFKELLGGVEWRVVNGAREEFREEEEEEIGRDELRKVIRKLKDRKAEEMVFRMKSGNTVGRK